MGNSRLRVPAWALFLFCLCAGSGAAQEPITGAVIDPSGASVPGATVELQRSGGRTLRRVASDLAGTFRFAGVPAGKYSIRVRHDGFKDAVAQVGTGPQMAIKIRLELAEVFSDVSADFEPVQVLPEVAEKSRRRDCHR